jgi:hypothetical protein
MSDTRRHVDDHILYPSEYADKFEIKSKKHHQKDTHDRPKKKYRFSKYTRNSKYNLKQKQIESDFDDEVDIWNGD